MPEWCNNKDEAFEALAKRWLGADKGFTAVSKRNRENRGSEGTHVREAAAATERTWYI
jgi:hypothetical protein